MGFIHVKKIGFLFLLISAAIFSTSLASRAFLFAESKQDRAMPSDELMESLELLQEHDEGGVSEVRGRILKVKTNDYGRYDPAPAFVKPPFKLIPN